MTKKIKQLEVEKDNLKEDTLSISMKMLRSEKDKNQPRDEKSNFINENEQKEKINIDLLNQNLQFVKQINLIREENKQNKIKVDQYAMMVASTEEENQKLRKTIEQLKNDKGGIVNEIKNTKDQISESLHL